MKEFSDPIQFSEYLEHLVRLLPIAQQQGLDLAAAMIQKEAKDEIGQYQNADGPYPDWEPLAEATLYGGVAPSGFRYKGKVELGYAPPDNPLLRDGSLREHITRDAFPTQAFVGVKSETVHPEYGRPADIGDVAIWQELGTEHMPARSFLGRAAVRKADAAVADFRYMIVGHLLGRGRAFLHKMGQETDGD